MSSTVQQGANTIQPFGADPKGSLIFGADGRYVAMIARAGLPKFAGDNRMAGTPEEYKAIVNGAIAHFGSYAADDKTITFRIATSTYPNWDGTEQKRSFMLTGDTLTYYGRRRLGRRRRRDAGVAAGEVRGATGSRVRCRGAIAPGI